MVIDDDTIKKEETKGTEESQESEKKEDTDTEVEAEESEDAAAEEDEARVWEDKYKRALADYQNLEKRVADQRREWLLTASRGVLERLLPVLDTLILAGKHVEDQGLKISIQQFSDVLQSEGVKKIETIGKEFDPSIMEAVGTGEGDDGKVVEEARAGYMLHEKLLRPAQVIVGKKKGSS